jgi:thymidylate synthase
MALKDSSFPIVDALLITPSEGIHGRIGICTNTTAPGQVLNEIEERNRTSVSVLGPLIVNRDGTERMILNTLAHPTLTYLILFSEESLTFSPSTNLLLAIQHGINTNERDHAIINGKAASAHYPNISKEVFDAFRENIVVVPMFMYKNNYSKQIITEYLTWIQPRVPQELFDFLRSINEKEKIYYDSLNNLIALIEKIPATPRSTFKLDPKEYQHLQPPKIVIPDRELVPLVNFYAQNENGKIRLDIDMNGKTFFIRSADEFLLEYSLMKYLGEQKEELDPLTQLFLGAEIARINAEIKDGVTQDSFVASPHITGEQEIMLESKISLVTDKKYYYRINVKEDGVAVMCLAFDICEQVFELRTKKLGGLLERLAEENRFEKYEMDILHRIDIGGQIGRAMIASSLGYTFVQDFPNIFKSNNENLPLIITEGDNFFDVHKRLLLKLYTQGVTEEHGDRQKGLARSGILVAIYRNTDISLATLPALYQQGEQHTEEMRRAYRAQLLRFDHDGDYSYGERTRTFFGFDQLTTTSEVLKNNPSRAACIQRFDPVRDMASFIDKDTGKKKYTHDPCLTHDIFFLQNGHLHSFHIARAHNAVNAYPENIFGLHDAYTAEIRKQIGATAGDLYMLSSRSNILLLTEEQRTKKLLGEPSKPMDDIDSSSGPYLLSENTKTPQQKTSGVAYCHLPLKEVTIRPDEKILDHLENLNGVNTINKAIQYLKEKGVMHNNPILSEYQAGIMDPQGDYLVFSQSNVIGGKVHTTAVFMNHSIRRQEKDIALLNYISTRFSKELGYPLGDLAIFYVAFTI